MSLEIIFVNLAWLKDLVENKGKFRTLLWSFPESRAFFGAGSR